MKEIQKYKGFEIILDNRSNMSQKWFNVFEKGVKQNNEIRSLKSVAMAKEFINGLIEAEIAYNQMLQK